MEACPSNDIEDGQIGIGRGGIAMCFHPRSQPLVYDQGPFDPIKIPWIRRARRWSYWDF